MNGVCAPVPLNGYRLIAPMFDLPDHVWRPEELHSIAYGSTTQTHPDLVRVALSRVRKSLAEKLDRDPIETVRGTGYRLAFIS
ncbi:helix-turn-helix domain-containing protein [Roseicyclus mahoneyensis]